MQQKPNLATSVTDVRGQPRIEMAADSTAHIVFDFVSFISFISFISCLTPTTCMFVHTLNN